LIGLTVKEFAHFRSCDRLFKILLEPDPARFQLTNFFWLHSIGLFQKSKSAGIIYMANKLLKRHCL